MKWKEEFSRDIARVLMEQYSSVADALFELVDNPIDFRRGRQLEITVEVSKEADLIVVEDHGGEGMDADGIAQWLRWGSSSREMRSTDISRWRVGGKAACGYLADRVVMYAKRRRQTDVWYFEDEGWATRSEAADWGDPAPLPRDVPLPRSLQKRATEDGYVRIELSHLRQSHHNVEDLRWYLSNTYRKLLDREDIVITVNGKPVEPLQLPRSSAYDDRPIDIRTSSGHRIHGWVGRLDRDAVVGPSSRRRIPGGLRCLFQGRKVADGEYFGHAGDTKGSLASLLGEVELNFVKPNISKTDFDRSSDEWREAEAALHEFLSPIVREFVKALERRVATREQRKTLNRVCDELADAFRALQQDRAWLRSPNVTEEPANKGDLKTPHPVPGYGGRQPPSPDSPESSEPHREATKQRGSRKKAQPTRTVAPEDSVGKMIGLIERVAGGGLRPPAVLDAFDPSERSGWRTENGSKIVVNTNYPLFRELGASPGYLAETVILELAKPVEGQHRSLDEYMAEVNSLILAWAKVRKLRGK